MYVRKNASDPQEEALSNDINLFNFSENFYVLILYITILVDEILYVILKHHP